MKKEATETAKQAGKFGVVGILNTVIDLTTFNILASVFNVNIVLANVVAVSFAIVNSYIWNKNWTFKDHSKKNLVEQFIKFVIFSLGGMAIQTLVVWFLATKWTVSGEVAYSIVEFLKLDKIFAETFVINNWAKVWGIALALVWNFIAYKKWTFKK
jgi:putative flippase GtrA